MIRHAGIRYNRTNSNQRELYQKTRKKSAEVRMLINRHIKIYIFNHILDTYKKECSLNSGLQCRDRERPLVDDLHLNVDKGLVSLLLLLDLPAAFDTEDHASLLRHLKTEVGIRGCALDWFHFFFTNLTLRVDAED